MITLEELQEVCELFVSIKSNKGNFMSSGDVSDELEEWTFISYNIMMFGFNHEDVAEYLEYNIKPSHWIS